jgi:AAA family ATP:ADP antiporter
MDERKTWLDRALSVVTDVRSGEGASALILAVNIFSVLTFYSVLKVIRDQLILTEGGAEAKSYSAAGQALLALAFVPAYAWVAARVDRMRLIGTVTLFFAVNLVAFALFGLSDAVSGIRIAVTFFIWTGLFSLVMVAQFWAFANDLYTPERGKRLFPLVGVGQSLGGVAGAYVAVLFTRVSPYNLMLMAATGLLLPLGLTFWANNRERSAGRDAAAAAADEPVGRRNGFRLVFSDRYLFLIAMLFVVLNLVNTLGGFLLDRLIVEESLRQVAAGAGVDQREIVGRLSGGVQLSVNILGFLLQTFAVSRIFKLIGVRGALFILPVLALGSYAMIAALPIFAVVRIAKILENSTDYSIQQTTRHALFLPTSREAKYNAKQAIESFFWRAGDLLQAVVVFVGAGLAFTVSHFAVVNVVLVLIWLGFVVAIVREHRKLMPAEDQEKAA